MKQNMLYVKHLAHLYVFLYPFGVLAAVALGVSVVVALVSVVLSRIW